MAKSMLLVPEAEFLRLRQQCELDSTGDRSRTILEEVKQPIERELVKTYTNMTNMLKDPSIPDQERVAKHVEAMNNFTNKSERIIGSSEKRQEHEQRQEQLPARNTTPTDEITIADTVEILPLSIQKPARQLLERLSRRKDLISWNESGEVVIGGRQLVGSHIGDLVGDVLRSRKTETPLRESFLNVLSQANVPDEFVRNKAALARYREIKGGEARKEQQESQQQQQQKQQKRPPGIPWMRQAGKSEQREERAMQLVHSALKAKKKKGGVKKAKRLSHKIKWKSL